MKFFFFCSPKVETKMAFSETITSSIKRMQQSSAAIFLCTVVSVVIYSQDIFQDILILSSSIHSTEVYPVLINLNIPERKFGFAMAIMFIFSVIVVGWDTVVKSNRLLLVKKQPWIMGFVIIACFLNLGPVFFIILKSIQSMARLRKMYSTEEEWQKDQQVIEEALSSTKAKEALCENLPMLVIVCFKMALSSHVSLLEVVSSTSSACLLSKVMITYVCDQMRAPLGWFRKAAESLILGVFIYVTLILITFFAIESERDGILVARSPSQGVEESSGEITIKNFVIPSLSFCVESCFVFLFLLIYEVCQMDQ